MPDPNAPVFPKPVPAVVVVLFVPNENPGFAVCCALLLLLPNKPPPVLVPKAVPCCDPKPVCPVVPKSPPVGCEAVAAGVLPNRLFAGGLFPNRLVLPAPKAPVVCVVAPKREELDAGVGPNKPPLPVAPKPVPVFCVFCPNPPNPVPTPNAPGCPLLLPYRRPWA